MQMQLGDYFYWLKLQSLDDWEPGTRLINRSKIRSIHAPTMMYENHQGRYFRPEQCYSTLEEAIVAMEEWIQEQQKCWMRLRKNSRSTELRVESHAKHDE